VAKVAKKAQVCRLTATDLCVVEPPHLKEDQEAEKSTSTAYAEQNCLDGKGNIYPRHTPYVTFVMDQEIATQEGVVQSPERPMSDLRLLFCTRSRHRRGGRLRGEASQAAADQRIAHRGAEMWACLTIIEFAPASSKLHNRLLLTSHRDIN
jgi:hypothetical protein